MTSILRSSKVVLRPVTHADLPRLFEILREPAVARRWSEQDDPAELGELLAGEGADEGERTTTFVILVGETVVGWIAGWEKLDRDYRHAGVDLFLTTEHHGKGLGPAAIGLVCRWLFDECGHHRITIDPAADNARAITAYEKVGFKRVGVLRRYERGPDGSFHDGLLLDMLREDLVDEA